MIVFDHAANQQRLGTLVNRYAYDPEEEKPQNISWEEYVNFPVLPRRSPWRTVGEDVESTNPTVSDGQVSVTSSNVSSVVLTGPITTTSSNIDQSALIAAIQTPAVVAAIVAALPIVEFSCPE